MATATLPDGRAVAVSGSGSGATVRMWDLTSATPIGPPMTGHTSAVMAVATATLPDGRVVAVTGSSDRTVRGWDLTWGTELLSHLSVPYPVTAIAAFDLDGPGMLIASRLLLAATRLRPAPTPT